jgi:hypothetical protein
MYNNYVINNNLSNTVTHNTYIRCILHVLDDLIINIARFMEVKYL